MQCRDRLAPRGGQIHQMTDPAQVLVEDVLRVRQVDMRLFRPADAEHEAAVGVRVGFDDGVLAGAAQVAGHRCRAIHRCQSLSRSVASRTAASSRTSVFLQKANRSRLLVRSAPSGWQNTGTGMAATPTRAGSRRASSTESLMPSGEVSTFTK